MLHADLVVSSGKQAGSHIQLPIGKFLVGREEDCHLRPNSDLVSRHHCVFTIDSYSVRLRDLGSTNGTYVNGERLRGAVDLKQGDKVAIGKLEFEVVITDGESNETSPVMNLETHLDLPAGELTARMGEPSPSETLTDFRIPEAAFVDDSNAEMTVIGDTQLINQIPEGQFPQAPVGQGQVPMGQMPQQSMPPGQMPQQPMMGYPMGYPNQYMPYGYQGYPGMYAQPPMGYPPGMYPQQGMYPPQQQMYPPQQQPGMMPPQSEAPVEEEAEPEAPPELAVKLPDPETSGAQAPAAPAPAKGGAPKAGPKIPDTAANIIKQYMNRKPTTGN